MNQEIYAVLTGDVINSSSLELNDLQNLMKELKTFGSSLKDSFIVDIDTYRGDSFQVLLKTPEYALYVSTLIRLWIMDKSISLFNKAYDARIAIGFGVLEQQDKVDIRIMNGQPFIKSGHLIDKMTNKVYIKTDGCWDEETNEILDTISQTVDKFITMLTTMQVKIVYQKLTTTSQKKICEILSLNQQNVSQYLKNANYKIITANLDMFKNIVKNRIERKP